MTQLELKKLLADQINLEEAYLDFCNECLVRIYGDKSVMAMAYFTEKVDIFDYDCCFPSLSCIDEVLYSKN